MTQSVQERVITKLQGTEAHTVKDLLAVEEPLEIRLISGKARTKSNLAVTMRTPGNDEELALGFLLTEGIITSLDQIEKTEQLQDHVFQVWLPPDVAIATNKLERNFYTTSSCGVCGKASIDAIKTECTIYDKAKPFTVNKKVIQSLLEQLRSRQSAFDATGGIHAAALFNLDGNIILVQEDVGRHNAMDKLVGCALKKDIIPLQEHILLLSGRASFELIQKATMAGIKVVAAVGAPSTLAVATAEEFGITLIGFLKADRFNIYTEEERIVN